MCVVLPSLPFPLLGPVGMLAVLTKLNAFSYLLPFIDILISFVILSEFILSTWYLEFLL
jgi:hypothetical protein